MLDEGKTFMDWSMESLALYPIVEEASGMDPFQSVLL